MPYALLSVSDKTGLADLGRALVDHGYTLLSTGGTGRMLREAGLPVTPVSEHTGAPEIMNGRVKTLHPRIHGGILGDRDRHAAEAAEHDIEFIDMVVCNLYPFERTIAGGAERGDAVENIDIGGPTMVRAAAKNHAHVAVVVDPSDYARIAEAIRGDGISVAMRRALAGKAFRHTARYDSAIAAWLQRTDESDPLPEETATGLKRVEVLRYGENPHQRSAFFADNEVSGRSLARAEQLQGKALSFNNLADTDGALRLVFEFDEPACAIIKHMNPAGCAVGRDLSEAFTRALEGDPVSAFGGIVVFNRPVTGEVVKTLKKSKTFFEVVAAPGFDQAAREGLSVRKKLRVLDLPADWAQSRPPGMDARRVQGGWLYQDWDLGTPWAPQVVSSRQPTDEQMRAMRFAWRVCRNVKSNAIVLATTHEGGFQANGVGAGQMSRVDSVGIAVQKATRPTRHNVLASDAFFPFPDGIERAAEAGVTCVVQPGGSIRDDVVLAAAEAAGMVMVHTGHRHFRH